MHAQQSLLFLIILMARILRLPAGVLNILLMIGVVIIWIAFAPTKIGGKASYVIIRGNSMEPKFHTGDLAIVRNSPIYQIGDVVAYADTRIGAYVIHRIINLEGDRYILKGDNNGWIDPARPGIENIIGKLWIHVPNLGRLMEWVRTPTIFAITMALLGGIIMTNMLPNSSKKKKKKVSTISKVSEAKSNGFLGTALYSVGILSLIFLALLFYAFSRPLTRTTNKILYTQEGQFSYSATGTPGIYDGETVQPGEPIFPKLTCMLNVGLSYSMLGSQVQGVSGSHQLYARVFDIKSGWQRTIPIKQETVFSGNTFVNVGTLDLCQVQSLVTTLEASTGLHSSVYTMEIVSPVVINAIVAGQQLTDTFIPVLTFKFDEIHFYIETNATGESTMFFIKPGISNLGTVQPNVIPVLGLAPTVQAVRSFAIIGVGLSLVGLLIVGITIYNKAQESQEALIRLKYGSLLVEVDGEGFEPTPPVVDVSSIENLARLAERNDAMILHISRNYFHDYLVQANSATYRYSISAEANLNSASMPGGGESQGYVIDVNQPKIGGVGGIQNDQENQYENIPSYNLGDRQPKKPASRRN